MSNLDRNHRGFTLLELIVVIVILGVLAALAIPTFTKTIDKSKEAAEVTTMKSTLRETQALSKFDDRALPTITDVEAAFSDLSAAAPGISAAGAVYDVVDQSAWPTPNQQGVVSVVYDADATKIGVAHISSAFPNRCLLGTVTADGTVAAWFRDVASRVDCEAALALDGPDAGDVTPDNTFPFTLAALTVHNNVDGPGMRVASVKAVVDGATIIDDDFERADGPVEETSTTAWMDTAQFGSESAVIVDGAVTAPTDAPATEQFLELAAAPQHAGTFQVSMVMDRVAVEGGQASVVAGTPTSNWTLTVREGGELTLSGVHPTSPQDLGFFWLPAGTVQAGDTVRLRVSPTTVTAYVNSTAVFAPRAKAPVTVTGQASGLPGGNYSDCTISMTLPTPGVPEWFRAVRPVTGSVHADGTFIVTSVQVAQTPVMACPGDLIATGSTFTPASPVTNDVTVTFS